MPDQPTGRSDPNRRTGYDRRILPDLERLGEKLDGLDELPEAFSREPRAVRQSQKKVWWKARKGRAK